MQRQKTYLLDDLPTDVDALDFAPYVETIVDVCRTASTPITIGVFGTWGSGKTSLMRMVKKELPRNFITAWFDAWKYDKEKLLWRAFLSTSLNAIRALLLTKNQPTDELDYLETLLYQSIDVNIENLSGSAEKESFLRNLSKIKIEQVRFLEQYQEKFRQLVEGYVYPNRLVIFVDNLDRCLPEKAVEILESIKVFIGVPNCVFILAFDPNVIARGIELRYKDFGVSSGDYTIDSSRYLENIIQVPFQIPPIERDVVNNFIVGLSAEWPHKECPIVFAEGLGDNPRQIKRTVSTFLLLWNLAGKRADKLQGRVMPIRLAKVVAIQSVYPELFNLIREEPRYLRELEEYYRVENAIEPPPALVPFLSRRGAAAVRRILTLHMPEMQDANFAGLPPDELRLYFTLTRRAESPQPVRDDESMRMVFEPQMVKIPAGKFLMGTTKEQARAVLKENGNNLAT